VLAVCHAARNGAEPPRIVLDRLHVLAGTRAQPVALADVEAVAYEAATQYRAPIRTDPWQAVGLAERLRVRGVAVTEWTFSPASVGRLAMTLHLLLREHRLALPDDAELLDELKQVRLRETQPGVYRLDHDASQHDDRAVALGLAALALTEVAEGGGFVTVPNTTRLTRTLTGRGLGPVSPVGLRRAAEVGPQGLRAILAPDSASDRSRLPRSLLHSWGACQFPPTGYGGS
jgi:hypothetical protein